MTALDEIVDDLLNEQWVALGLGQNGVARRLWQWRAVEQPVEQQQALAVGQWVEGGLVEAMGVVALGGVAQPPAVGAAVAAHGAQEEHRGVLAQAEEVGE